MVGCSAGSGTSAPTLTIAQFTDMMQVQSPNTLDTGTGGLNEASDWFPVSVTLAGVTAVANGGDSGNNLGGSLNLQAITLAFLFDSPADAAAALEQSKTWADPNENGTASSATNSGVAMVGYLDPDDANMSFAFAQYGNVLLFHDDGDSAISWTNWQGQASTFKKAVDQAASK